MAETKKPAKPKKKPTSAKTAQVDDKTEKEAPVKKRLIRPLNVRTSPDQKSDHVFVLFRGAVVTSFGKNENGYECVEFTTPNLTVNGYILSDYLEVVK